MKPTTIVIGILVIAVAVLFYYVFAAPPVQQIAVVETRIVPEMSWRPWSWGAGGWGWPGAFYVSRPMPNFYPRHHDGGRPAHRDMGPVAGPGPQFGGRIGIAHTPSAAVQNVPKTIAPKA